jgi:hypothetical protein
VKTVPNITLHVDGEIVRKVRKIAVDRNTTLTEMVREYLTRLSEENTLQAELAVRDLEEAFTLYSRDMGRRTWTREELHER